MLIVLVIGICFVVDTRISHACSCARPGSASEALRTTSSVFVGKVIAVYDSEIYLPRTRDVQTETVYAFKATTVWKGPLYETVFISNTFGTSCDRWFAEGEEYLVYGGGHLCSRTSIISEAHEDLAELGAGRTPVSGTSAPIPDIVRTYEDLADPDVGQTPDRGTSAPEPNIMKEGRPQAWFIAVIATLVVAASLGFAVLLLTQRRRGTDV